MRQGWIVLFCGTCAFGGGLVGTLVTSPPPAGLFAQDFEPPPLDPSPSEVLPPEDALPTEPPLGPPPPANFRPPIETPGDLSNRFTRVVREFDPSVVSIDARKTSKSVGSNGKSIEESGSGFLVRLPDIAGTLVFTNNHVIADAPAEQITVHLSDSRIFRPSKVWADPESDVAVMRIDRDDLPVASLGDSSRMEVGQWVLAFGSPFGLTRTVTHGIISARQRGEVSLGTSIRIKSFLQTDAAINPGSSGGPLVNLNGEVIGINTAIASKSGSNAGIAFAIPINLARDIAIELIRNGSVQRAYIGVQLAAKLDPEMALRLGLSKASGALVEAIYPGTPASQAGVKVNDVILQVDGTPIRNENHLINMIASMRIGQQVRLQIWRDGAVQLVEIEVGDWSTARAKLAP